MVLQLTDLHFRYPGQTEDLLVIPNFEMKPKEKVFLFGPSGSGKSTLLELIAGIQVAKQGRLQFCGKDLAKLSEPQRDHHRARHLGFIFQSFNLLPFLSVAENIELGAGFSKERREQTTEPELDLMLSRLGLSALKHRKAGAISVGQAQRVAAARALYGKPELVLADEPTSALDFDHRENFLKLLFTLAEERGQSLLFVSHDRSLAPLFDRSVNLTELNSVKSGSTSGSTSPETTGGAR